MNTWGFPSFSNAGINGLNLPGIETYKANRIKSLAREICQNSMDAAISSDQPVIVEFNQFFLKRENFPGRDKLIQVFKSQIDFWDKTQKNDKRPIVFFKNALRILNRSKISFLRVSDFNTTGLTDSDKHIGGNWANLVKSTGVSDKSGSMGGSFGIGKNAVFASSDLYTVFYSTIDKSNNKAFQGVSRLSSFEEDGDIKYGLGYYGDNRNGMYECMNDYYSLDRNFDRKENGTDIYIAGFRDTEHNWEIDLISSLIDNFFMSIHYGKLIIKTNNYEISKENLDSIYDEFKDHLDEFTNDYFSVLNNKNKKIFTYQYMEPGDVKLWLVINPNMLKRIAVIRQNGMKIFDKDRNQSLIGFSGILLLEGQSVNAYFKEMENPEHNSWDYNRHTNSSEAKTQKEKLYTFIRESIRESIYFENPNEVDAAGIADFLPDFDFGDDDKKEVEGFSNVKMKKVEIKNQTLKPANQTNDSAIGEDEEQVEYSLDENEEIIKIGEKHDGDGEHPEKNQRTKEIEGKQDREGNIGNVYRRLIPKKIILIEQKGKYTIKFLSNENIEKCSMKVKVSGEQRASDADIVYASRNNSNLNISEGYIDLGVVKAKEMTTIEFSLRSSNRLSMEVLIYENQSK